MAWAVGATPARSRAATSFGMVEDLGQLFGEVVELTVGELQPGQRSHVSHVGPGEPGATGHQYGAFPGPPMTSSQKATTFSSMTGASQSRVATW